MPAATQVALACSGLDLDLVQLPSPYVPELSCDPHLCYQNQICHCCLALLVCASQVTLFAARVNSFVLLPAHTPPNSHSAVSRLRRQICKESATYSWPEVPCAPIVSPRQPNWLFASYRRMCCIFSSRSPNETDSVSILTTRLQCSFSAHIATDAEGVIAFCYSTSNCSLESTSSRPLWKSRRSQKGGECPADSCAPAPCCLADLWPRPPCAWGGAASTAARG